MQIRFILALSVLLLAGCVHYHVSPIDPAKTAAEWESRSLDSQSLHSFLQQHLAHPPEQWPIKSWRLDELTVAAFFYNPSLEVARAQWRGAQGSEVTAAQRPNPTVTLSPGYDFTATSLGANPWLPGTTVDVPIETMGKRRYRKAQAAFATESARLALMATAWGIRSNVCLQVANLEAWREKASVISRQLEIQEKIVKSLLARVEAGVANSTELTLVQAGLHKVQSDLADARQQERDALFNLADAMGVPAATLEKVEFSGEGIDKAVNLNLSAEPLRDAGLKNRTDVLGALADYSASEAALHLQIAKQYPDIHFAPNYQYNQGDHQFLLGLSAELPLLNQNKGPIAEAVAKRTELGARFYQVQTRAIEEIEHALKTFNGTLENAGNLRSLADAQERQANAVAAQAEAGSADQLDLLNSKLELLSGKLARVDASFKQRQAVIALENAIQRPIETIQPATIQIPIHRASQELQP